MRAGIQILPCRDGRLTHLVTVSLQPVEDVATSFSHVHFAPVYHLLVNVHILLRTKQSRAGDYVQNLHKRNVFSIFISFNIPSWSYLIRNKCGSLRT